MSYSKPVPAITAEMRPFFEAAARNELRIQRCTACGTHRFPARAICSECLSLESEWVPVSGRGEIFSFNVMHQVYHPGFAVAVPYAVALVELDDGGRMLTNVVACPIESLRVGLPVEVTFEQRSADVSLPQFRPRA